jgi:hypothetical protein
LELVKNIEWPNNFATNDDKKKILINWMIYNEIITEELLVVITRKGKNSEGRQKKRQLIALENAKLPLADVMIQF